jgi:hypothetical protein
MKTRRRPAATLLIAALAAIALAGCDHKHLTSIGSIEDNPGRFDGQSVEIAGHVSHVHEVSAGIADLAAYQVDDGTGRIWVLSHAGAPDNGRGIWVKGTVHAAGRFGSEALGAAIEEHDRRVE